MQFFTLHPHQLSTKPSFALKSNTLSGFSSGNNITTEAQTLRNIPITLASPWESEAPSYIPLISLSVKATVSTAPLQQGAPDRYITAMDCHPVKPQAVTGHLRMGNLLRSHQSPCQTWVSTHKQIHQDEGKRQEEHSDGFRWKRSLAWFNLNPNQRPLCILSRSQWGLWWTKGTKSLS